MSTQFNCQALQFIQTVLIHQIQFSISIDFVYTQLNAKKVVTLCRWSTKQTIPLYVLAQNQTKGFGLEISGDQKWVRERQAESWTKELEEGSWRGTTDRGSRHERAEKPVGMR